MVAACSLLAVLVGCAPAGPRALLDGKKHLERGEYQQAVEELRSATQLMPTNALAYSYLGLASHLAGQPAEAERAYQRALALDHDLTEVHFNLGCLWLGQSNRLDQAKSELTTYTLRRPNSVEGWLKLGQAQLHLRELSAAEKSYSDALRLNPRNAEALTGLGLTRYQRRRPAEAAQFFEKALQEQPDYAPALLNQAVILQQDSNDPRAALQKYRQYLALKPVPENASAVAVLVRQLEQELAPKPALVPTNAAVLAAPAHTNSIKTNEVAGRNPVRTVVTNSIKEAPARVGSSNTITKASPSTNTTRVTGPTNSSPAENVEVVKLAAEPVIKPAEELANSIEPGKVTPSTQIEPAPGHSPGNSEQHGSTKKGFFQRINPINLFSRDEKATNSPPPVVVSDSSGLSRSAEARTFPRYAYRSPQKPAAGNREAAEHDFSSGVKAQQARRLSEAIQDYRRAAQLDPAYYDAHYNLGLAATEAGNLPLALAAYETALTIQPDSLDARYNFGLVLKQAGYVLDAIDQFQKVLATYPNDGRTHLALGNLYAQQLQDTAKARQHYQAVLALAPQSPQAGAIRYWLTDHPR